MPFLRHCPYACVDMYTCLLKILNGHLLQTPILPTANHVTSGQSIGVLPVMTSTPCLPLPDRHFVTSDKQASYYRRGKATDKASKRTAPTTAYSSAGNSAREQFRSMLRAASVCKKTKEHKLPKRSMVKAKLRAYPSSPPLCVLVQQSKEAATTTKKIPYHSDNNDTDTIPVDILTLKIK